MEYMHTLTHTTKSYSTIIKEENLAVCDNVDGLPRYYAKWTKSGRESKNHMISLKCEIWKTKQMNKENKNKLTDRVYIGDFYRGRGLEAGRGVKGLSLMVMDGGN